MRISLIDRRAFISGCAALSLPALRAQAEPGGFPARPVKFIVPVPPGAQLDAVARVVGDGLRTIWGQPVVVENRPGASGNVGAEFVSRADPDGFTLLATHPGPLVTNQWLYSRLGFDPDTLVPVAILVRVPPVLVANANLPVADLADFLSYAKTHPNKITYGSPGTGTTPQLAMQAFAEAAGLRLTHVPYQGLAPAQRDLLAGQIDLMIDMMGNVLPQLGGGKLKILAVTGEQRLQRLPQLPSLSETISGFAFTDWFAVAAPPNTPHEVAKEISSSIVQALAAPEVGQRLAGFSMIPVGGTPEETATFVRGERERWRRIIADSGIKME